jgi:hypothetical protein
MFGESTTSAERAKPVESTRQRERAKFTESTKGDERARDCESTKGEERATRTESTIIGERARRRESTTKSERASVRESTTRIERATPRERGLSMTKNETAIAAMAIVFGVTLDRALKNVDPKLFAVKVAEHWDVSAETLEQAANNVSSLVKEVEPAWLNLKL